MRPKLLLGTGATITLLILGGVFLADRFTEDEKQNAPVHPNPESGSTVDAPDEDDEPLGILIGSMKSIINWDSWSPGGEPLHIKAASDDAVIIFRFKQPPEDLKSVNVTSNAAVYAETDQGLVPLTDKAWANPMPLGPFQTLAEPISIEGPAPVLRDR